MIGTVLADDCSPASRCGRIASMQAHSMKTRGIAWNRSASG
jgi:hypothetical protein